MQPRDDRDHLYESVQILTHHNKNLESNLTDLVKLFFISQLQIEKRISKVQKINDISMEFMNGYDDGLDDLLGYVEQSGKLPASLDQSLLMEIDDELNEINARAKTDTSYTLKNRSSKSKKGKSSKSNAYDITNEMSDKRSSMNRDIFESRKAIKFISQYLSKLTEAENSSGRKLQPEDVLKIINEKDFLEKTSRLFAQEKNLLFNGLEEKVSVLEQENKELNDCYGSLIEEIKDNKGVKMYISKINDLQKKLREKEEEIYLLKTQNKYGYSGIEIKHLKENEVVLESERPEEENMYTSDAFEGLRGENIILLNENENLRKQLEQYEEKNEEDNSGMLAAKEHHSNLESMVERIKYEKQVLVDKDLKMREDIKKLHENMSHLKDELNSANQLYYELKIENQTLLTKISKKNEELDKLQDEIERKDDLMAECQNARN